METVVILIMLLVGLSFLLKLTFMKPWQMAVEAALVAAAVIWSVDLAVDQSKTQIEGWLGSPELMLDLAVILTVDVALQISFCITAAAARSDRAAVRILRSVLLFLPGLLIFPVAFFLLVRIIFASTGVDFDSVGYMLAGALFVAVPLLSGGLRLLLPERELRLELIFFLNCLTGLLGVIATVNGRTAFTGVNELNLPALCAMLGLTLAGAAAGLILYRHKTNKQS